MTVSCGQCIGCRREYKRGWAVRMMHELQITRMRGSFLTLTLNPEHLPGNQSLDVRVWQNFAKKLRRNLCDCPRDYSKSRKGRKVCTDPTHRVRFFMCGEYGELNWRPHYHAAVMSHDFMGPLLYKSKDGFPYWTNEVIAKSWTDENGESLGHHAISEMSFDSAAYVAGYITKKVNGGFKDAHYWRIDTSGEMAELHQVKPEFATMSRGGRDRDGLGGLGHRWIEKYMDDVYPQDRVYMNGFSFQPPAYYDAQLEKRNPEMLKEVKAKREENADTDNATNERLIQREKFQMSRMRQLMQKLPTLAPA